MIFIDIVNKINPKYLKAYDIKYDDRIHIQGNIKDNCNDSKSYDTAIILKEHCSLALKLIKY